MRPTKISADSGTTSVVYVVLLVSREYIGLMKLFRLKRSRFWDWERTVEDELGRVGWLDSTRLLLSMARVLVWGVWGRESLPVKQARFRQRMKCCMKCPIYERNSRVCRPYPGSVLGCGCYMPYAAQLKKRCWADENMPDENIGWESHTPK